MAATGSHVQENAVNEAISLSDEGGGCGRVGRAVRGVEGDLVAALRASRDAENNGAPSKGARSDGPTSYIMGLRDD